MKHILCVHSESDVVNLIRFQGVYQHNNMRQFLDTISTQSQRTECLKTSNARRADSLGPRLFVFLQLSEHHTHILSDES